MPIQASNTSLQTGTLEQFKPVIYEWLSNFKSQRTGEAYLRALYAFLAFNEGLLQEASKQDVIDYRNHLAENLKRANTTINQHLSALSSFYGYLLDNGSITENPVIGVKQLKVTPYDKTKALDIKNNEHLALLNSIDVAAVMGARDYAIILMLLTTGLRVSALATATTGNLEASGKSVLFHYLNKGGESKVKKLTGDTLQALKHYFSLRLVSEHSPLFASIRGRSGNPSQSFGHSMSRVAISKMITKRARQAGVSNISAHSLRHTSATFLSRQGYSVSAIQKFLEHSDRRTTLIYLDHITDDTADEINETMSAILTNAPAVKGRSKPDY